MTDILYISAFHAIQKKKKEHWNVRFSERYCEKLPNNGIFVLEYHKTSVKNKHRALYAQMENTSHTRCIYNSDI